MSLPGPLPYEAKRFGTEREAPTKRAMRPYTERLALADKLIDDTKVKHGTFVDSLPKFAELCLVAGAFAPVVLAIPGFGSLLFPLVLDSYPFSAGLIYATEWLASGWAGATLVAVTGALGLLAAGWSRQHRAAGGRDSLALVRVAVVGLGLLVEAAVVLKFGWMGTLGGSVGAVWVVLTGAAAVYGAYLVGRRENWLGALGGGVALFAGGRFIFGTAAIVALVFCDKAFPGQNVARHPWKRSEVALEPIAAPSVIEAAPEGTEPEWTRPPPPQSLLIATLALVFGAFSTVVLAIPGFGVGLFGELLFSLWPVSIVAIWSAGSVIVSVGTLLAGGAAAFGALFILLWLVALPAIGGVIAARAVATRRRRWAAVTGALLLVVGGRPILGVVALVCIAWGWTLFDKAPAEGGVQEPAPSAAAH